MGKYDAIFKYVEYDFEQKETLEDCIRNRGEGKGRGLNPLNILRGAGVSLSLPKKSYILILS